MGYLHAVCREREARYDDTLADLLEYWRRGLLSCEEMLHRWHARSLTEDELVWQLWEELQKPLHKSTECQRDELRRRLKGESQSYDD